MIPTITSEQKAALNDRGYFVLENLFTISDMDVVADAIEGYVARHEAEMREKGGNEGISRASEISFTDHLAEKNDAVRAFVTRPEFVAITSQILGDNVDLYWNQSVFKMPEGEKEFPWHQDDGYDAVDPSPYLTIWLALNDATPENGCISVLPESHKRGLLPHTPSPIGLVCHAADDPDQGVLVPVGAGSVAIFWSLTAHKSGVNRSQGVRKAFVIQYSKAPIRLLRTGEVIENLIPVVRNGHAA